MPANNTNKGRRPPRQHQQQKQGAQHQQQQEVTKPDKQDPPPDEPVCFICAEPIKYYAVSACNHRTCHVCALRLRALYKKTECTFCKEPQPTVIFTESPDAPCASFSPESIQYKDTKLDIFFESQEMMDDSLLLLRFNCPDSSCDHIANGWSDLRLHVRATHGKLMCDLCIRFKKVFAHEHALYLANQLYVHLPSIPHRPQRNPPKDIEGGIHPYCEFCRECFFSDDELYSHMRERHEECFVCKRNEIRDQYFQNYDSLERHFNQAHYTCSQPSCLAQKFVVFNTALDLKGHMMDVHGADMSAKDRRDTRRIEVEFEEVGGGGFGRRGRRDKGDREREGEPPPQPSSSNQPQRPEGAGRRRVVFGSSLTTEDGPGHSDPLNQNNAAANHRHTPDPLGTDVDPVVAERHAAFIRRVESLAPNPVNATPAVKAAIRGFRASESSARDLISTIWNVLDRKLEQTASVVNSLVDLLDEEEKKQDLLSSWRGFDIEQRRHFPDLVPTATGSGFAGVTSGRVLNIKHSSASRSSHQSSRQVWDRVAQAAGSSSSTLQTPSSAAAHPSTPQHNFPPLQTNVAPTTSIVPKGKPGQRNTPWSASAQGRPAPTTTTPKTITPFSIQPPPSVTKSSQALPKLNKESFPELPASSTSRHKPPVNGNQSLKKILGPSAGPSVPAWGAAGANDSPSNTNATAQEGGGTPTPVGTGKKGKGKQKQTVYSLGSFRTG